MFCIVVLDREDWSEARELRESSRAGRPRRVAAEDILGGRDGFISFCEELLLRVSFAGMSC